MDITRFRLPGVIVSALMSLGALVVPQAAAANPRAVQPAAPGTISTIVGGVGGPARATSVNINDCGITAAGGSLYFGDGNEFYNRAGMVRKVSASGWLTTPAGTGASGPLGNGGLATAADLYGACGVALDHSGNLVISEQGYAHQDVIQVMAASTGTFYAQHMIRGDIYKVAGLGHEGPVGSGRIATRTALGLLAGVTVDQSGNLVIADGGWQVQHTMHAALVQVVATSTGIFYGQAMIAGHIYTVAGHDQGTGFSGNGGPATKAALGSYLGTVRTDAAGNLLVADAGNNQIRVVAVRTGTFYGQTMIAGHIYAVAGDGTQGFSGDGGPATSAELFLPRAVSADAAGNLVIADRGRVRVVAASSGTFYGKPMTAGDIYSVAGGGAHGLGDGGPATRAVADPEDVTADGAGNLVIADMERVRVVAEKTGTFYGVPMTAGDIYTVAGNGTFGYTNGGFSGDGGPAAAAQLNTPHGVTADNAGNVVIADTGNNRIRVRAASTGMLYGMKVTAGHIYTVAGNGTAGFSGDGGPASSAELGGYVIGAAVGATSTLLISDSGSDAGGNFRVRVVPATSGMYYGQAMTAGFIYTAAGNGTRTFTREGALATRTSVGPAGVAADHEGNLLIADGNRIQAVAVRTGTFYGRAMTAGHIYAVAGDGRSGYSGDGGPATSAELYSTEGVAVDSAGDVVIADPLTQRIRLVAARTGTFYGIAMTAGDIYTVAGNGIEGYSGDGGPSAGAELNTPYGVAVDSAGNLLIADTDNYRIRVVTAGAGTFYGMPMTAGDIYTVAGNGGSFFSGDGGASASAEISAPVSVAAGQRGLVFADTQDNRIRQVAG